MVVVMVVGWPNLGKVVERERERERNRPEWFPVVFLDLVPSSTTDEDSKLKKTQVVPYLLRSSIILSASSKTSVSHWMCPSPNTPHFWNFLGNLRFLFIRSLPFFFFFFSSSMYCSTHTYVFYFIGLASQEGKGYCV